MDNVKHTRHKGAPSSPGQRARARLKPCGVSAEVVTALQALPELVGTLTTRTNALLTRELGLQQTETDLTKMLAELTRGLAQLDLRCPLASDRLQPEASGSPEA